MYKLSTLVITVLFMILPVSCVMVTVHIVKPGRVLTSDNGYIAIVFTNKVESISFGIRNVYTVLRQADSGRRFYIPFGSRNKLRLIAVAPGNYRIEDFVCMSGIESVKGYDFQNKEKGVLYNAPQRSGTSLVKAGYPEDYCKDFTVNSGEIVYIGGYSWESKLDLFEPPVAINRSVQSEETVFSVVQKNHPNMPASIKFVSLSF